MRTSIRLRDRRPSLLVRFALISLILLVAVGLVLGRRLADMQRERSLADAVSSAQIVARAGIQPLLTPDDLQRDFLPIDVASRARLDQALTSSISQDGIVRLKIWNEQHWIVYSDNPLLVGRWFAGDDGLQESLRGVVSSEITDLSGAENLEERDFGRLLAVYVPMRVDQTGEFTSDESGRVVGSFEIYVPHGPIAAGIADDTRTLYVALSVGFLVLYLGLFRLVSGASKRLRRQANENAFQATHDALTGLPNRIQLLTDVARLIDQRQPDELVALVLVDLDRFKDINDTLGHPSGDRLLQAVALRLAGELGQADVARIGGDEFVIAAGKLLDLDAVAALAESVTLLLDEPFTIDNVNLVVRGSAGVAVAPLHGQTAEELLQRADTAMYVAKRSGIGHQIWAPEFDRSSPERLGLAAELRGAISSGQISMVFQPKVHLATDTVTSVEALVRWKHPQRGLVSPGEFLPIIENTELIGPLTWEVLDQSLASAANWRRMGLEIQVAVNLSARTVGSPELVERVRRALAKHDLPASALELELTESALLGDHGRATHNLERLRDMGVSIAVDDFGTGYASIAYLTTMPISVLKIDQSFIAPMLTDQTAAAVVGFSLSLAEQLGLRVVAEGIEDDDVLEELRRRGCTYGQGYLFTRPLPPHDFIAWLLKWNTRWLHVPDSPASLMDTAEVPMITPGMSRPGDAPVAPWLPPVSQRVRA
jgi:diguanylate cyclase (GGDEF)-like protein